MTTKKASNRTFLCQEGSEKFHMKANSLKDAKEKAQMYNAVVICEITTTK